MAFSLLQFAKSNILLVNVVGAMLCALLADAIVQFLYDRPRTGKQAIRKWSYNPTRTARLVVVAGLLGFVTHKWYVNLDNMYTTTGTKDLAAKIVLDEIIMAPLAISSYIFGEQARSKREQQKEVSSYNRLHNERSIFGALTFGFDYSGKADDGKDQSGVSTSWMRYLTTNPDETGEIKSSDSWFSYRSTKNENADGSKLSSSWMSSIKNQQGSSGKSDDSSSWLSYSAETGDGNGKSNYPAHGERYARRDKTDKLKVSNTWTSFLSGGKEDKTDALINSNYWSSSQDKTDAPESTKYWINYDSTKNKQQVKQDSWVISTTTDDVSVDGSGASRSWMSYGNSKEKDTNSPKVSKSWLGFGDTEEKETNSPKVSKSWLGFGSTEDKVTRKAKGSPKVSQKPSIVSSTGDRSAKISENDRSSRLKSWTVHTGDRDGLNQQTSLFKVDNISYTAMGPADAPTSLTIALLTAVAADTTVQLTHDRCLAMRRRTRWIYNPVRTGISGFVAFLLGIIQHFWNMEVEDVYATTGVKDTAARIILDAVIASPLLISLYVFLQCYLQGMATVPTYNEWAENFTNIYITNLMYWPVMTVIFQEATPTFLQPTFDIACEYVWSIFLIYNLADNRPIGARKLSFRARKRAISVGSQYSEYDVADSDVSAAGDSETSDLDAWGKKASKARCVDSKETGSFQNSFASSSFFKDPNARNQSNPALHYQTPVGSFIGSLWRNSTPNLLNAASNALHNRLSASALSPGESSVDIEI